MHIRVSFAIVESPRVLQIRGLFDIPENKTSSQVSSAIVESPRVLQIRGLFDIPENKTSSQEWDVELPLQERRWNIGLIVGPSGSGKSTVASHLWPQGDGQGAAWARDAAILDSFPAELGIKEVAELLSSVGFSSPPAWLRPFHVLSIGQQFRVTLARAIAEAIGRPGGRPIVFDEYTSVVDRTVAQIGSAAVAKVIRAKKLQFVAVTCHEDVEAWLNPDWVYRPAGTSSHGGCFGDAQKLNSASFAVTHRRGNYSHRITS